MNYTMLGVALVMAGLDWLSVWRCWRLGEYVFKPAAMLALIAWFWQATGMGGQALWFGLGLIFSLAGDVFLMLPVNLFMAGLAAFLLAHLTYAGGFNPTFPPVTLVSLILVVLIVLAAVWLYRKVMTGLTGRPKGSLLRRGVLAYSIAITLMVISAVLTLVRPNWSTETAVLAALGSLLFFASDSTLALDRFVSPIRNGKLLVHMTYHLGQIVMMLGVARHLVGY